MTVIKNIRASLVGAAIAATLAGPAAAGPVRDFSVPMEAVADYQKARLVGPWFEVARSRSLIEPDCHAVSSDVATREDSRLTLKIACHKGSVDGPVLNIEGIMAEVAPGVFRMRFVRPSGFGDLTLAVLWQADDDSLAVVGTPGGQIGWVWSKTAVVDAATLELGREKLVSAGYKMQAIQPVKHAP